MTRLAVLLMVGLIGLVPLLSGCGTGHTRTFFAAKTNVGLEVSTTPPTAQLDISQLEGVVSPQFENGKKLPVMSSFRFDNSGFFSPAVGSAFATGDAAKTMAALYDDDTPIEGWKNRINEVDSVNFKGDSKLELDNKPTVMSWMPSWLEWARPKFQKKDVRPVFFGTDTALGVKVAWSGMTGELPDTAVFGYNRKEIALVPISMKKVTKEDKDVYEMKQASLLATLDTATNLSIDEDERGLDFNLVQYFATGDAANLLALQKDVRKSMLTRLDPHGEELKKGNVGGKLRETNKKAAANLIFAVYSGLDKIKGKDESAKGHVAAMNSLVEGLSLPNTYQGINLYSYAAPGANKLEVDSRGGPIAPRNNYATVTSYLDKLRKNVDALSLVSTDLSNPAFRIETRTAAVPARTLSAVAPTQLEQDHLKSEKERFENIYKEFEEKLSSNSIVIDAVNYYLSLLQNA